MIHAKATLTDRKILAPDIFHLFFSLEEGAELIYIPGQYIILTIPSSPTPVKRLYSFAGSNKNGGVFELLVKLVPGGVASEYLKNLPIDGKIDVSGPAGLFSLQETPLRKIYMVTGTGFAPIRSLLVSGSPHAQNSTLFWGMRDFSEAYMMDELLNIKNQFEAFSFFYCLSQQKELGLIPAELQRFFRIGHIDEVWLAENMKIEVDTEYYLCGSRTVIESLRTFLLSRGVNKSRLFFEKY
jgi:Na+-transporting NADH:ubiquinone oxidoreductase subunit F